MKPLGKKHTLKSRQYLAENGIELTPDELVAERKAAYKTIREELRKRGLPAPESDEELFLMMQAAYRSKKR